MKVDFTVDKPREECGIFGIFAGQEAGLSVAETAYLGLYALQHRGQESAGIAVSDGKKMRLIRGMGLVAEVFDEDQLSKLQGHIGIGHVRYSTAGESSLVNAQPLLVQSCHGQLSLAHNGNLVNAAELREMLMHNGSVFQTVTDSEVIINLVSGFGDLDLETAFERSVGYLQGAYALVAMSVDKLIGIRDPHGFRPLCLGKLGDSYVLASETCALGNLGADLVHEVAPGEMVVVDDNGYRLRQVTEKVEPAFCVFEYIYFARPDSQIAGRNVHEVRKRIGRVLARENPVAADIVIAAPDSGTSAAMGFAEESGLPFDIGLIKNRYVGRTFIQPGQQMRRMGVRIKLNPIEALLRDKRVVIVDDSIVRGTTSEKTVQLLRDSGAKEVYMFIASPPYLHSCYYGIDTPTSEELIACNRTVDEICRHIGADRLSYISIEGLCEAIGMDESQLCTACFSGRYCTPTP